MKPLVQASATSAAPRVTVVTIFLNGEEFLEEAIQSVIEQSFPEWELLLVDDGSSDGASDIAKDFAARHPEKIRYLEHDGHQNRGMSASRNLGLRHAKGELIAFLDADDVWLATKLEEQVSLMEAHPELALVYGPGRLWFSWQAEQVDSVQTMGIETDRIYAPPDLVPHFIRYGDCTPSPSVVLIRTELLRSTGGSVDEFRGMFEDQVLVCKIAARAPVYVSSTIWYNYRQHDNSCCAVSLRERTHQKPRQQFLVWLKTYLKDIDLNDERIEQAWREQWSRYFGVGARLKDAVRPFVPSTIRAWFRSVNENVENSHT